MIDEDSFRQVMIGVFEHLKRHEERLQAIMREAAALRKTLEEASDGKFLPLLQEHFAKVSEEASDAERALIGRLDKAIHRLKSGDPF